MFTTIRCAPRFGKCSHPIRTRFCMKLITDGVIWSMVTLPTSMMRVTFSSSGAATDRPLDLEPVVCRKSSFVRRAPSGPRGSRTPPLDEHQVAFLVPRVQARRDEAVDQLVVRRRPGDRVHPLQRAPLKSRRPSAATCSELPTKNTTAGPAPPPSGCRSQRCFPKIPRGPPLSRDAASASTETSEQRRLTPCTPGRVLSSLSPLPGATLMRERQMSRPSLLLDHPGLAVGRYWDAI